MNNISEELRRMMENIRNELGLCFEGCLQDEDGEKTNLYDYLVDEALDVDFRVDCYKKPIGCRVWIAIGGPNIWIDTEKGLIEGAWGVEREILLINEELCGAILEALWQ